MVRNLACLRPNCFITECFMRGGRSSNTPMTLVPGGSSVEENNLLPDFSLVAQSLELGKDNAYTSVRDRYN